MKELSFQKVAYRKPGLVSRIILFPKLMDARFLPVYASDEVFSQRACSEAESYFYRVLFEGSVKYGRAAVVSVEGVPLGIIKFYGNSTFLSGVNVKNSNGCYPLLKRGIYSLEDKILELYSDSEKEAFQIINVDSLRVKPNRPFNRKFLPPNMGKNVGERLDEILQGAKRNLK